MTLSAITKELEIVTPFKLLSDNTISEVYRAIRAAQEQGKEFFCPHCFASEVGMIPVVFRGTDPSKARPHFAHSGSQSHKCPNGSRESEAHVLAKGVLAGHLREFGALEVHAEHTLNKGEAKTRRPDVMALWPDRVEAHEIQISALNSSDLEARTADLISHLESEHPGLTPMVVWYLTDRNLKAENADWASKTRATVYRLRFDQDSHAPKWTLFKPPTKARTEPKTGSSYHGKAQNSYGDGRASYPVSEPKPERKAVESQVPKSPTIDHCRSLIRVGQTYTYQGRSKDLQGFVKVIADRWPGDPNNPAYVHAQKLTKKGEATENTFGCHPGWLAPAGGTSPMAEYDQQVKRLNDKLPKTKVEVGLPDPQSHDDDQGGLWDNMA